MTSQIIAIGFVAVALFVGSMTACRPRIDSRTPSPTRAVPAHAADFDAGVEAYKLGDYATALPIFRQLADQGNAFAQYNLGLMYTRGEGVPQDYKEAVKWYRKAADQGQAKAQVSLGFMYLDGNGVTQDYAVAARWFRKAADQGNALAQARLGLMYWFGRGVAQDYVQAHMWFNLAAARGLKLGRKNRDSLAKQMTPAQIAEAQKIAQGWKPKGQ